MKRIIAILIIVVMTFPMYALDLIIMRNGDTYLGTILSMDVNDKVTIKLQDGKVEELKFKDINSFKKIETESPAQQSPTPNIVIQNTNTNENIIGSTVVNPLVSGSNEIIKFIPSTKKTPTKCVFQGVEYPISKIEELEAFYNVLQLQYPNIDGEIKLMFESLIKTKDELLNKRSKNLATILTVYGFGSIAALVAMGTDYKYREPAPYVFLGGCTAMVSCLVASLIVGPPLAKEIQAYDAPIKNIVGRFNFLYAK